MSSASTFPGDSPVGHKSCVRAAGRELPWSMRAGGHTPSLHTCVQMMKVSRNQKVVDPASTGESHHTLVFLCRCDLHLP